MPIGGLLVKGGVEACNLLANFQFETTLVPLGALSSTTVNTILQLMFVAMSRP